MSQENVDAVRAVYEEWGRGNFRAGVDLYDPLCVFIPMVEFPGADHYLGPEGVKQFMLEFLSAWTQLAIAAEDFLEAGDSVVVTAHWTGAGRESGVALTEYRVFDTWTFRGRSAIRFESFTDRAEALDAVGLSE